jgi:hypothetical protein
MNKTCPICNVTKPLAEFGFTKGRVRGYCRKCNKTYCNNYTRQRYATDSTFSARERERAQRNRSENKPYRTGQIFHSVRQSAAKRGIAFNITREQIAALLNAAEWKCAQTGIAFDLTTGQGRRPFGPTVDRIDNSRGYELSNIQVVCNVYNYAKSTFSHDDVLRFATALTAQSTQETACPK